MCLILQTQNLASLDLANFTEVPHWPKATLSPHDLVHVLGSKCCPFYELCVKTLTGSQGTT